MVHLYKCLVEHFGVEISHVSQSFQQSWFLSNKLLYIILKYSHRISNCLLEDISAETHTGFEMYSKQGFSVISIPPKLFLKIFLLTYHYDLNKCILREMFYYLCKQKNQFYLAQVESNYTSEMMLSYSNPELLPTELQDKACFLLIGVTHTRLM